MKIGYISDVHLEFLQYPDLSKEIGGDILILAGDILTANLLKENRTDADSRKLKKYLITKFKKELLDNYKQVIYVMGNHEHYHYVFNETIPTIKNFFEKNNINNVFIMNNDHYVYRDVVFVGSTLWSNFMNNNPISKFDVQNGMNDYRIIYKDYDMNRISTDFILNEFDKSFNYIKNIVNFHKKFPCVVVTHMAPSFQSVDIKHSTSSLNGAYASDLTEFITENENIKFWVHGHTHSNVDYMIGNCNVLSNQLGYYFENVHAQFSGIKHFEV